MTEPHQLWGGRFAQGAQCTAASLVALNCSLPYDKRLFAEDIDSSKAYAEALQRAGLLSAGDCERVLQGFELLRYDWLEGKIQPLASDEDVHTVNERRLIELVGEVGERVHTGRSRNDQVATDMRLWLRKGIRETLAALARLISTSVTQAQQYVGLLMPGYTHMQRAQTVQFSHWLLSHVWALREDSQRLCELRERANVLPLGSGAIAGNPLGIDREWLAKRLGFKAVSQNSMHAVADRDFVVDFVYCCSMVSLHLSRWAEDLIIYSTREFDFVRLSDTFATGSSLMPQKRNPDSLELVRGISALISSQLVGIMMTIKGTPSTYNKDLQFDKQYCFEAFDKLQQALNVMEGVIATMTVKRHQLESALSSDMLATDWAYYLVHKGVPFRKAHHYIGAVVAFAEKYDKEITEIPLDELQKICPHFASDIVKVVDYDVNVEQYNVVGGTASAAVLEQIRKLQQFLQELQKST